MQPAPGVGVIIVAYKSRREIAACLASLPHRLDDRPVEVLVVDNSAREDDLTDIVRNFPHVRYIAPTENIGFGRANNQGYAELSPSVEYVLFLNPDTICNGAALTHCLQRLASDDTIGLISPKLVLADGSMDLACRRSIPTLWDGFCRAVGLATAFPGAKLFAGYNLTYLPENGTYDVGAINGAFMMGRRAVFETVAGRDTREAISIQRVAEQAEATAYSLPPIAEGGIQNDGRRSVTAGNNDDADEAAPSSGRSQEIKADSLPLTAAGASSPQVFDERFFMYGDDLDLCIRVKKAGFRIVYDGRIAITHLKGTSVAKEYQQMSRAIFDANRDVFLKHFTSRHSKWMRWKYIAAFAAWKALSRLRAAVRGHRKVRPL